MEEGKEKKKMNDGRFWGGPPSQPRSTERAKAPGAVHAQETVRVCVHASTCT